MPFTIQSPKDVPVVTVIHSGGQLLEEMEHAANVLSKTLDAEPEPVFLIIDIRGLTLGFDEMAKGAKFLAHKPDVLDHPNVRENLMISTDALVRLTATGLRAVTFGHIRLQIFESMEEAIDYCREQIITEAGHSSNNSSGPHSMAG